MAPPILAALRDRYQSRLADGRLHDAVGKLDGRLALDLNRPRIRRLLAALGMVACLLALGVRGDAFTLLLTSLAGVLLTACALHADEPRELHRFVIMNGVVMLLLTWGALESTDLIVERAGEQLTVTMGPVQLGATLAAGGISGGQQDRVAIGLSGVEARPYVAAWVYDVLPRLRSFGYWLAGGMRGAVGPTSLTNDDGTSLAPPLPYTLQPDSSTDPPPLAALPEGWTAGRALDGTVLLVSPPFTAEQFRFRVPVARPSATVLLSLGEPESGPALDVLAAPDRRQFEITARESGRFTETLVGGPFTYRRTVIGWVQALLRELGRAWLVGLALVAAARLVVFRPPPVVTVPWPNVGDMLVLVVSAVTGLATLALTSLVALFVLEGIPHTLESISLVFEGQVMVLGSLWAPAPSLPQFFQEPYILIRDGRWFGVLPPGQSVLLAVGLLAGAPWVISPLASANAVALTVLIGRAVYGRATGALAGMLLLFSPFLLLLSGDMLPHPTALLLTVLIALCVLISRSTARRSGAALGGFAAGCLLMTRPLALIGAGLPILVLLFLGRRRDDARALPTRLLMLAAGAAIPLMCYGAINAVLTGSPFMPASAIWSEVDRIGFGEGVGLRGGHDLANGLGNLWANTVVLERHLYGWPSYFTLALALVPFVRGTRQPWDWVLLASAAGLGLTHVLYWSDGIVYGPRFAFEAIAALTLLTARGFALLGEPDRVNLEPIPPEKPQDVPRMTAAPIVAVFAGTLIALNLTAYLPDVVVAYHGYNGVSRDSLRLVNEAGLHQALVFVTSTGDDWQSYGEVFLANGPLLDRDVIFARNLGDGENYQLIGQYPGWSAWLLENQRLTEMR